MPAVEGSEGEVTITYDLQAPDSPGRHFLRFAMVKNGEAWFGGMLEHDVEVTAGAALSQERIDLPTPIVGPTQAELTSDGAWRDLVVAYRRALTTELARRYARLVRMAKTAVPNALVSARQGYGGNGSGWAVPYLPLELSTGVHFDFISPEAWAMKTREPTALASEMELTTAYARWVTGTPVFFAEYGWNLPTSPYDPSDAAGLADQADYYERFLGVWRRSCADGAMAWWWAGGLRQDESSAGSDYGLVRPEPGNPVARPALDRLRQFIQGGGTRGACAEPSETLTHDFEPTGGARGEADIFDAARAHANDASSTGRRLVFRSVGKDTTSLDPPRWIGRYGTTRDLWAEIHQVELRAGEAGSWFEVQPGRAYAVPAEQPIFVRARVRNSGVAAWQPANVYFAANESHGLSMPWVGLASALARRGELRLPESQLVARLDRGVHRVQFQMVANGKAWIGGAFPLHLVAQ